LDSTDQTLKQADGWASSLVPLLFLECGDLQSAINKAYNSMAEAIGRFETAADEFISKPSFTSMSSSEAQALIQGCKDIWVGNLVWRYVETYLLICLENF
jgi:hypothetical protein